MPLEISHITKSFSSAFPDAAPILALDDVSLSVADGECVLVTGSCGSGKSVLMRIAAGLIKADSGTVSITHNGKPAKAALVFQDADTQILGETLLEDVMFSLKRLPIAERKKAALRALESTGLASRAYGNARSLSGGQKRCLAVASAIALNRPVVIFDEPYSNLDLQSVIMVNSLIVRLKEEGRTLIIITHETEKSLHLATRMIVLQNGKKMYDGNTSSRPRGKELEKWGIKEPSEPWMAAIYDNRKQDI